MSGIATMSREFVKAVEGLPVQILDTRKTTPLLRFLEKEAVRLGGATNYRYGLYDRIMIKDNHTDASGGIENAVHRALDYLKTAQKDLELTVEVRNLEELRTLLRVGSGKVQRVMLDNFSLDLLKEAVAIIGNQMEIEASGGVSLKTVRAIAETRVQFISAGALTHSAGCLDMSLKVVK
jgi:nicotinate-nucleotide pyrophosphorylase (carboxylating)